MSYSSVVDLTPCRHGNRDGPGRAYNELGGHTPVYTRRPKFMLCRVPSQNRALPTSLLGLKVQKERQLEISLEHLDLASTVVFSLQTRSMSRLYLRNRRNTLSLSSMSSAHHRKIVPSKYSLTLGETLLVVEQKSHWSSKMILQSILRTRKLLRWCEYCVFLRRGVF